MNATPLFPGIETLVKPFKFPATPYEYKVTPLRECPLPESLQLCDTPDKAAEYWKHHIATHPYFNPLLFVKPSCIIRTSSPAARTIQKTHKLENEVPLLKAAKQHRHFAEPPPHRVHPA
jgi:hypothetical protein